jgi:hypothetical protein
VRTKKLIERRGRIADSCTPCFISLRIPESTASGPFNPWDRMGLEETAWMGNAGKGGTGRKRLQSGGYLRHFSMMYFSRAVE